MNYWVFKCDRAKYRLDDRLIDPAEPITWRVTRYSDEIKPGDLAFISQIGSDRGIRAVMEIKSVPDVMPEIPSEIKYWLGDGQPIVECRVKGKLTHRCNVISFKTLKTIHGLEALSIYSAERQTNFRLTKAQGEILMGLIA